MQKTFWSLRIALSAGLLLAAVAGADDSFAPCWRGKVGTTFQDWTFNTASNNPAAPDTSANANGIPQVTFTLGSAATGWRTSLFSRTNVWDLGVNGSASLVVPNYPAPSMPWKYVQVQVTYFDATFGYGAPLVSLPGAILVTNSVISHTNVGIGTWKSQRTLWLIQPSPVSESVSIACANPTRALLVDQIVVDTRCPLGGDGDVPANQPCWRGQTGTTFQHWMFGLSNNPVTPELVANAYGSPSMSIVKGSFSSGYISENSFFGCRQGLWNIGSGGSMTMTVPNLPAAPAGTYKYVQVQVAQYRDGIYSANAGVAVAGGTQVGSAQETTLETLDTGGEWIVERSVWRLTPSPASDTVVISAPANGSVIDQIVVDTLTLNPPCPADILVDADSGQCSKAGVTWSLPAVSCTIASATSIYNSQVVTSPHAFPVGTNLVVSSITDAYGAVRTCPFYVVVKDVEPPTVASLPNLTVPKETGQCGAHVSYSALAADNCSGATVTFSPPSGSLFPLGLSTVSYYATDAAGNTNNPATFTVRVVDYSGDVPANQPCWRGLVGSTFQQWAFSVPSNPPTSELVTNSYGSPSMTLVPGAFSSGYLGANSFFGCRQGMWNLGSSGSMTMAIPNVPSAPVGSYKYVQVQVTQYRDSLYGANAGVAVAGAAQVGTAQETVVETVDVGREWVVEKTVWKLGPPSPGSDTVVVTGAANGSVIDQVVVDTLVVQPAVCPLNIVGNTDLGQCSKANVTWSAPPVADGCLIQSANDVPASGSTFALGVNTVTRTILDAEGQANICTFTVTINDTQPPAIPTITVTEVQPFAGLVDVKNCAGATVQGTVNFAVTVSDACPLPASPTLVLTNAGVGVVATYVSQSPAGTYNYTWPVTSATANGTWTATVAASDTANTTTANFTLCVNTIQVTGQVELQGFVGTGTVPAHSRLVTFVATQVTPSVTNVLKTWNLTVANGSGATFSYSLIDVPAGTTHVSAKTAWNLRRKLPVVSAGPSGTANFTGASSMLLGGDINATHDNAVNTFDRSVLLGQWLKPAPGNAAADLTGDGNVNTFDRSILLGQWLKGGDPL